MSEIDTPGPEAPLFGVRIADLTGAWAGAFATQILGDLGAEVIKIEALKRPDVWRGGLGTYQFGFGEPGNRPYNRNGLVNSVNRNKLGITLDLGTPPGRELFLQLVAIADVVAENFTPRVMGNFGLDFATLAAVRPGVIMLSMPAYGDFGPYSEFAGIGGTVEPMSGNSSMFVGPEGRPLNSGDMYPDAVAGLFGASSVLTALYQRERNPEAQYINLAQLESMVALMGGQMVETALRGAATRWDDEDPEQSPSGHFRCRDGAWLAFTARNEADQLLLARLIGAAGPAEDGADSLRSALVAWCSGRDGEAAESALVRAGLPAALVRPPLEYAHSEQLTFRDFMRTMPHAELGSITTAGIPWRLSETPARVRLGPPVLGEHSERVLHDLLGVSLDRIAELAAVRITGTSPPEP